MTIRQFTSDPLFRQRYWARNHIGWRHMDDTLPNAGHRALATLERAGVLDRSDHAERSATAGAHQGRQRECGEPARHLRASDLPWLRLHDEPNRPGRAARGAEPGIHRAHPRATSAGWRWLPTPTLSSPTPRRSATSTVRVALACSSLTSYTSARLCPKKLCCKLIHWSTKLRHYWSRAPLLTVFSGYRIRARTPPHGPSPSPSLSTWGAGPRRRPGGDQGRRRMLRIADAAVLRAHVARHRATQTPLS